MFILFLVPKNLWLYVHIVFCLSWIGNVAVNIFGSTGSYFASSSMFFSCNYPILILYLQWKTKFFPSLLMTCWWYDWLFKRSLWCVICANILQFLCRLLVFKLAQDFLLQTFSWCYHKSKTLNTGRIFPLRDLIHLIWLQENKTAVVSNRFIYLVWELKWLSFYQ